MLFWDKQIVSFLTWYRMLKNRLVSIFVNVCVIAPPRHGSLLTLSTNGLPDPGALLKESPDLFHSFVSFALAKVICTKLIPSLRDYCSLCLSFVSWVETSLIDDSVMRKFRNQDGRLPLISTDKGLKQNARSETSAIMGQILCWPDPRKLMVTNAISLRNTRSPEFPEGQSPSLIIRRTPIIILMANTHWLK